MLVRSMLVRFSVPLESDRAAAARARQYWFLARALTLVQTPWERLFLRLDELPFLFLLFRFLPFCLLFCDLFLSPELLLLVFFLLLTVFFFCEFRSFLRSFFSVDDESSLALWAHRFFLRFSIKSALELWRRVRRFRPWTRAEKSPKIRPFCQDIFCLRNGSVIC